jgi:PAS domain S-box-containing protein
VSVFVDLYQKQRQLAEQQQLLAESERRDLELRHMRELYESEARFSEIVASAMDAIVVFDTDGYVRLFNTAAERMFGIRADLAVSRDVRRFFPESRRQELLDHICEASDDGIPPSLGANATNGHVLTFDAIRENGEEFPVEATASCLDVRGKRTFTLILRDISERKRVEVELSERQLELERAMAARSRFYASMSHELRTPINAVLGYSTLLLEHIYGPLNEKQEEGIARTHKAAKHLLELVNDVLDLSKIEAGKIDLRLQPVAFPGLIEDLFVTVRPLADQYGSQLSIDHEGEPVKIVSDPRRLRQILLNLLSNAIKFGRGNPIRVHSARNDLGGITIEVIDRGEGIAPADREKIFDEFVQLGKTQLTEGTGLGLPISRRLAEMLDGKLEIESELGEGSTFRLIVPGAADAIPLRTSRVPEQDVSAPETEPLVIPSGARSA